MTGSDTRVGSVRSLPLDDRSAAMASKFWGANHGGRYARFGVGGSLTFGSGIYSIRPNKEAVLQGAINRARDALGRRLALELAPAHVDTGPPGLTATPLWDRVGTAAHDEIFDRKAVQLPTGRFAQANDVVEAILFVATNPIATGSTVLIDGGDTLV